MCILLNLIDIPLNTNLFILGDNLKKDFNISKKKPFSQEINFIVTC